MPTQKPQHIRRRRLRPLAPKGPYNPSLAVQGRPHQGRSHDINHDYNLLEHTVENANPQRTVPINLNIAWKSVSPGYGFRPGLEQNQNAAVADQYTNTFSNRALGVGTCGNLDFSTQHPPNIQFQLPEASQNHARHDYWVPRLGTPEVTVWVAQQNIGDHQSQWGSSISIQITSYLWRK